MLLYHTAMKKVTFQVGDIAHDKLEDRHYLVLKSAMYEQDEYYKVISLEDGDYIMIGYFDYLTSDRWEKVA